MRVTALKGGVRRVWVDVPDDETGEVDKVWVDYRPGELTLEMKDKLLGAAAMGLEAEVAEILLGPLLVDWDLEDANGEHLPPDPGLKQVPLAFIGLLMEAIQEDSIPNAQRGETSAGTSLQEVLQDSPQNGTSSSEQQTDSSALPGSS